jgi:Holliday junction DNA helicase RuvA
MIVLLTGTLLTKTIDRVELMTAGGIGYEVCIPLSVYETLPKPGELLTLHTSLVVKEELWQLFGFSSAFERRVFEKLLTASGVGPALAIGLLSSLTAPRAIRAILEKDIATLQSVPRVGRKKAERLILDLADKLGDIESDGGGTAVPPAGGASDDAVRALVSLGYTMPEAERGVRDALDGAGAGRSAPELIRTALAKIRER